MPKLVPIAADSQMLESLRESEFDCYSAYGEVIDNSIQAGATFCRIRVNAQRLDQRGKPYERIVEMAFGDDGIGMDADTLHQCLSLGWSSRFGDRNGIGRFGVGMTLGAIHEARRVEVYSRCSKGPWRRVYIDLDEMSQSKEPRSGITEPTEMDLPAEYVALTGRDSGTVVIWKKYDRQPMSYGSLRNEIIHWAGRTFRKFIWGGFKIALDGAEVAAFDPLYAKTESTKFPGDERATLFSEQVLEWPLQHLL